MATYNTAFGTLPGYNEMLGTTNTTGGGEQQVYSPTRQFQPQRTTYGRAGQEGPVQTFAQLQRQGMARPAPVAPQAQPVQQFGGSQQAQQMRQRLQQQLEQFGQAPSRFDTAAFQQIRGAQAANLQAEYQAQQQQLNEELARRGLYASSIGGGRMGDLAGQQARALAALDAELLGRAAETQAADRAQLLQAGGQLAELAAAQDLAQFEANRVAQAAEFENQLRAAQFAQGQYEQGTGQALQAAQAQQAAGQFGAELGLRLAELTGQVGGAQTLAAQQQAEQRRQFDIQQALQQQLGLGGLTLEQQRLATQQQQFGVTTEEQRRQFDIQQALQAQLGLGGLTLQERQQLAQEQQFAQDLLERQTARSQQFGISAQELDLRARQLQQEAGLQGRSLDLQQARDAAEVDIRSRQLQQEAQLQGRALGIDEARIQAQRDISRADNEAQLARLREQIASAESESQLERELRTTLQESQITEQARQFNLERSLREALGLTEAAGYVYTPGADGGPALRTATETVQGQLARSNMALALAQALSGLTSEQIGNLLGRVTPGSTQPTGEQELNLAWPADDALVDALNRQILTIGTDNLAVTNPTQSGMANGSFARINGVMYQLRNGKWYDKSGKVLGATLATTTSPTTTPTSTPTGTTTPTTTTTPTPSPTATPSPTLAPVSAQFVPSWIPQEELFEGRYYPNGNVGGTGWTVYRNGQWYVSDVVPQHKSVQLPNSQQTMTAYPGQEILWEGSRWQWNGSSWRQLASNTGFQ